MKTQAENVNEMAAAGYYVGNTVEDVAGVRMYAGGPGVMEPKNITLVDIMVSDAGVKLIKSTWKDGKFQGLVTLESFATACEYLQWVAVEGIECKGGMPAFANSWD